MTDQQTVPHRLTPEERAERNLMRQKDAEQAMAEHDRAQEHIYSNMERLRAERLKREAAAASQPAAPARRTAKRAAGARA